MENKVTVSQIGLRYGIIMGLVFIIYGMILQFLDLATNQALGYVNYLFLILGLVLAHKAFKDGGDGYMSIGQGLGIGMLISLIGGVISSIFTYIYIKFIDDSFLTKIKDIQIEKMEEQGLDDAQIEQAMAFTSKLMSPEMIPILAVFFMLLFGFILSLIVSLFTKKANPNLEV